MSASLRWVIAIQDVEHYSRYFEENEAKYLIGTYLSYTAKNILGAYTCRKECTILYIYMALPTKKTEE
jgi:hypothetical protein